MAETAFLGSESRAILSQEKIQIRIQECHAFLGETDELDCKRMPIERPSDAVKVLRSSIGTLQQLSETVRLSSSPVVIMDTSNTTSAKQHEATVETTVTGISVQV